VRRPSPHSKSHAQAITVEQIARAQAEVMPEYEMGKIIQALSCCTPSSSLAAGDLAPPDLRSSSRCAAGFMVVAAAGMVYVVKSLWHVASIVRYKMGLGLIGPWWARQ
jgi:hypothetical protein